MNADPALVDRTKRSLKFRRSCTAHETSEPNVAVAITHGLGDVVRVVTVVTVVAVVAVVGVVAVVAVVAVVVVT
jgi:hypothetical protein